MTLRFVVSQDAEMFIDMQVVRGDAEDFDIFLGVLKNVDKLVEEIIVSPGDD